MRCVVVRVPPNWEHPTREIADYFGTGRRVFFAAMFPEPFERAEAEWLEGETAWKAGTHPDVASLRLRDPGYDAPYDDWVQRPVASSHAPWAEAEATWYQLWETVTEGTPLTPPFETFEALSDHLLEHGEDYAQTILGRDVRSGIGWDEEAVERLERFGGVEAHVSLSMPSPGSNGP